MIKIPREKERAREREADRERQREIDIQRARDGRARNERPWSLIRDLVFDPSLPLQLCTILLVHVYTLRCNPTCTTQWSTLNVLNNRQFMW